MNLTSSRALTILYGTQTGTAKDLAQRLGRDAKERHISAHVTSMNEYQVAQLPQEKMIIFVCSTTGDGDVPDAMLSFWRFLLRRDLSSNSLSNVKCAVFGLGDSAYAQFNVVARKLQARLGQLGAINFHPLVLGDDQSPNGLAGDVDAWLTTLWIEILNIYPLPNGITIDTTPKLPLLDFQLNFVDNSSASASASASSSSSSISDCSFYQTNQSIIPQLTANNRPTTCKMIQNKRMTSQDWHQDVRHIILCPTESNLIIDYKPGDIAVIYPTNVFNIDAFAQLMGYDPNSMFTFTSSHSFQSSSQSKLPLFPTPCTVRNALKYYINILGVPTRRSIELLSFFCTNKEEQNKLIEIGRLADGADLYHSYLKREKRSFVELFEDFKSCKPPLDQLLSIVPPLLPREFSIASSPNTHGNEIHLAVALVEFVSYYKRQRYGVCTQWLSTLSCSTTDTEIFIPLHIKRGRVHPIPIDIPVLLIGPGTGIAPIMSILHDRDTNRKKLEQQQQQQEEEGEEDKKIGVDGDVKMGKETKEMKEMQETNKNTKNVKDLIFFGCRHRLKDYLFENELNDLCQNEDVQLNVAFSRDAPPNKVYVQHLIGQNADAVWSIIDPKQGNGIIVLSGSSQKMPQDVMKILRRIVEKCGHMTEIQANKFLRVMKNRGRCIIECW